MRTKIFTDTTCDLSPERRAAHDITALPLHVFLGETDYLDGVDVTPQQLFDYALQNKQLPKTAAVGEYDFENAFRERFNPLAKLLHQYAAHGLACQNDDGSWRLTPKGFLVSNQIIGALQEELSREKADRLARAARGDYRVID